MNNEIKFYIPEDQAIPTNLRLKKGKVHIYYERLNDKFGYEFQCYEIDNKKQGEEIVKEVANMMCSQSYDHGQEWRIVSIDCVEFEDNGFCGKSGTWQVEFRIRDSY